MRTHFIDNNSKNLLVFFCGWGMDHTPFSVFDFDTDVLFLYDYCDLKIGFDFSRYESKRLLAFSFGVYVFGLCKDFLPEFDFKTAINGILKPVDDKFGIPEKMFLLSQKMDGSTIVKFRERLFDKKEHLEIFNRFLPERSAKSCTDELLCLHKLIEKKPCANACFDRIYISTRDRVIPSKNQFNFWNHQSCQQNPSKIITLESGHFPFYSAKSLKDYVR